MWELKPRRRRVSQAKEKTMRIILRYWEIAEFVSLSFEKYKKKFV